MIVLHMTNQCTAHQIYAQLIVFFVYVFISSDMLHLYQNIYSVSFRLSM